MYPFNLAVRNGSFLIKDWLISIFTSSRFKYKDYKKALEYFNPGGFSVNFDLQSHYLHLNICPHHRQFLSFAWIFPDGREFFFFMFNVLTFGLCSAPYIFYQTVEPARQVLEV